MIFSKTKIVSLLYITEPIKCCLHFSDCLSSFTDVEELEDTELYMCGTCKLKQRSTKRFWIRRLPNVSYENSEDKAVLISVSFQDIVAFVRLLKQILLLLGNNLSHQQCY